MDNQLKNKLLTALKIAYLDLVDYKLVVNDEIDVKSTILTVRDAIKTLEAIEVTE